jgi:hypothetical protein
MLYRRHFSSQKSEQMRWREDVRVRPRSSAATKNRSDSKDGAYFERTFRRRLECCCHSTVCLDGWSKIRFRRHWRSKPNVGCANPGDVYSLPRNRTLAARMGSRHHRRVTIVRHRLAANLLCWCHLAIRHHARHDRHRNDCNDQKNGGEL